MLPKEASPTISWIPRESDGQFRWSRLIFVCLAKRRSERQSAGWQARYKQASGVDFLIDSPAGVVRRRSGESGSIEVFSAWTRKSNNQAQRVLPDLRRAPHRRRTLADGLARWLVTMVESAGKIVSVFEPDTEIIRRGKASEPEEFGKPVTIQEAFSSLGGGVSRLSKTDDRHNRHRDIKTLANSFYGLAVL